MIDGLIERIERDAGVPDLLQILTTRLSPTALQSLLLEVHARLAEGVTPKRLLAQYETNRFVVPSAADPRALAEIDRLAWSVLPPGYVPIELAPLCPLGTSSAVTRLSQNRAVSTVRNTEVAADSTNILALECAIRRRGLRRIAGRHHERVLLAASQRVTRPQRFAGPLLSAHFRLLSLCAAGRDEGAFRFETAQLLEQIAFYVSLMLEIAGVHSIRVALTDMTGGSLTPAIEERIIQPLSQRFPDVRCHLDPNRQAGRGYYDGMAMKIFAVVGSLGEIELADGGPTDWTRRLLSDRKERLVISGLGVERLCAAPPQNTLSSAEGP